jgi:uncharacterized protein involved in response to NO
MVSRPAFALFAYGFRPFFLGAGWFAVLALGAWLWVYGGGLLSAELPPHLWHGHEMLFGFVAAAIAGFMLTAVPNWTGARGFAGLPLVVLASLWLAGRIAFAGAGALPWGLLATIELAFLPALALLVSRPLIHSANRNTPLLAVLGALWLADGAFLLAVRDGDALAASRALHVTVAIVVLLITVIGGRIVPAFTGNALRRAGLPAPIRSRAPLEWLVIGATLAIVPIEIFAPNGRTAALIAALAAAAHAARLLQWRGLRTLREPIVWVLHAAYAWIPMGLALKATALLTGAPWAAHWLHALTIGAAATMILAVMTRASLGHTGRPLVASRPIAIAYALLITAAAVRVFGPSVATEYYAATVFAAGALWIAAFALFAGVYSPILVGPRADGRPG